MEESSYFDKINFGSARLDRLVYVFNMRNDSGHETETTVKGNNINEVNFSTEHDLETHLSSISYMNPITFAIFWVYNGVQIQHRTLDFYMGLRKKGLVQFEIVDDSTFRTREWFGNPSRPNHDTSPYYVKYGLHGYHYPKDTQSLREVSASLFLSGEPFQHNHGYIILGCSGSGKSTLIDQLSGYMKGVMKATKVTTRSKRPIDLEANITCIRQDEFMNMLSRGHIIGTYSAYGNFYGYLKGEIDTALKSGTELFIDTTSLSAAVNLRENFPDYFRIVAIDSDEYTLEHQLVNRHRLVSGQESLRLQKAIDEGKARLDHILDAVKLRERIIREADLVLYEHHFAIRQQKLRDYMIDQRFPGLIIPPSHPSLLDPDRS